MPIYCIGRSCRDRCRRRGLLVNQPAMSKARPAEHTALLIPAALRNSSLPPAPPPVRNETRSYRGHPTPRFLTPRFPAGVAGFDLRLVVSIVEAQLRTRERRGFAETTIGQNERQERNVCAQQKTGGRGSDEEVTGGRQRGKFGVRRRSAIGRTHGDVSGSTGKAGAKLPSPKVKWQCRQKRESLGYPDGDSHAGCRALQGQYVPINASARRSGPPVSPGSFPHHVFCVAWRSWIAHPAKN